MLGGHTQEGEQRAGALRPLLGEFLERFFNMDKLSCMLWTSVPTEGRGGCCVDWMVREEGETWVLTCGTGPSRQKQSCLTFLHRDLDTLNLHVL